MKLITRIVIVLALAIALALLIRYEEGVVSVVLPPYRFDLAANMVALTLMASFVGLYFLIRILTGTIRLPKRFAQFSARRRHVQAVEAFNASVMALNEGRFEQAEQLVERAQRDPQMAGPAALVGARAAHAAGNMESRHRWLGAVKGDKALERAREIFTAEAALDDNRPADCLIALKAAREQGADSLQVMRLEMRALEMHEDWEALLDSASRLARRGGISEQAAEKTRVRAWQALFSAAAGDETRLLALRKRLSRKELKAEGVTEAVAEAYAAIGKHSEAAKLVEAAMPERLSPRLLVLYTRLDAIPARDRLVIAQGWLTRYTGDEEQALILAALGRLCMVEQLWGKAEQFLREANQKAPSPFTRLALAEMYEQLGRGDEASGLYRSLAQDHRLALSDTRALVKKT